MRERCSQFGGGGTNQPHSTLELAQLGIVAHAVDARAERRLDRAETNRRAWGTAKGRTVEPELLLPPHVATGGGRSSRHDLFHLGDRNRPPGQVVERFPCR